MTILYVGPLDGPGSCKWEANKNTKIIASVHCFPMRFSLSSFPEAPPHSLERVRRLGAVTGHDERGERRGLKRRNGQPAKHGQHD